MSVQPDQPRRAIATIAGGVGSALAGLVCLGLLLMVLPSFLGYERYVLAGSSMEPALQRGSLIFDAVVPAEDIRPGDIITYVPPGSDRPVTHRVVDRTLQADGQTQLRTKGDNNTHADMRPIVLERPVQARVAFAVPYVGYVFILLASEQARTYLLVAPAFLIALWMLGSMWRDAGRLAREQGA